MRTVFGVLALVPVIALVLITMNIVLGSTLAFDKVGTGLFATTLNPSSEGGLPGSMRFGLVPALWGTLMVVAISMCIAFPISLALACLANDFAVRFSGTAIRWMNGVLSGIPPIVYGLVGTTFYIWFLWAKVGGKGLSAATDPPLPPPGTLPTDASATLLGGFMLSLLIIPFMTPLLDDALHNVPSSLKEASLALGAGRWHTLKAVSIPYALPGIVNAALLGMLTALGESIIVAYAIGLSAQALPTPLYDVLQRTAPLTATIATLAAGGFTRFSTVGPIGRSVANVMGLLLLVAAFAILGLSLYLQRRIRKRLAV